MGGAQAVHTDKTVLQKHLDFFLIYFGHNPTPKKHGDGKKDKEKGEEEGKESFNDRREFNEFIARKEFGQGFDL